LWAIHMRLKNKPQYRRGTPIKRPPHNAGSGPDKSAQKIQKKLTLIERGEHIHSGNNTDHFIVVSYKNAVYVLVKKYLRH